MSLRSVYQRRFYNSGIACNVAVRTAQRINSDKSCLSRSGLGN